MVYLIFICVRFRQYHITFLSDIESLVELISKYKAVTNDTSDRYQIPESTEVEYLPIITETAMSIYCLI